jgi:hypothetical protein
MFFLVYWIFIQVFEFCLISIWFWCRYWVSELEKVDPVTRFFRILKKPDVNYLTRADFVPLLQG